MMRLLAMVLAAAALSVAAGAALVRTTGGAPADAAFSGVAALLAVALLWRWIAR